MTLVPTKSTLGEDGTSGQVRLQGAQGYNNSVKLLNDACSKLYGNEAKGIKAVIGNEAEKVTGLGLSDPSANFIKRSEGTSTTSSIGAITTATSIQPCQTYWSKDATFMQTAFDEHTK